MFSGGGKDNEDAFHAVLSYVQSSDNKKTAFLQSKFQRDSSTIQSTYMSLQDLAKKLNAMETTTKPDHVAHMKGIHKIYYDQWQDLVAQRRQNEVAFGTLFTNIYGVCKTHTDNMWFVWDTPNAPPVCVECDYERLEILWAKQRAGKDTVVEEVKVEVQTDFGIPEGLPSQESITWFIAEESYNSGVTKQRKMANYFYNQYVCAEFIGPQQWQKILAWNNKVAAEERTLADAMFDLLIQRLIHATPNVAPSTVNVLLTVHSLVLPTEDTCERQDMQYIVDWDLVKDTHFAAEFGMNRFLYLSSTMPTLNDPFGPSEEDDEVHDFINTLIRKGTCVYDYSMDDDKTRAHIKSINEQWNFVAPTYFIIYRMNLGDN